MFKRLYIIWIICFMATFVNTVGIKAQIPTKHVNAPNVSARCAIAMDSKSKIVLYEKNSDMIVPMASTTKIITAMVAMKYGDMDKKVPISHRAASIRGSKVGYKAGEQISIRELVYGLMLRSGNDAAIAIAEGIAGNVGDFCRLMTEMSHETGLVNSHFESPHGLDSENHYTTVYDLALATAKAKEIKEFNEIVSSKEVDGKELGFSRSFRNINKILWQLPNANGVKTGFTGQAGKCLVSSVSINNNDVIIIVLNSPGRWRETIKINDYITKQYEYRTIAAKDEVMEKIYSPERKDKLQLVCAEDITIPIKKSAYISKKICVPSNAKTSPHNGDYYGKVEVYEDNKLIYSSPLKCGSGSSKGNKPPGLFKKIINGFKH